MLKYIHFHLPVAIMVAFVAAVNIIPDGPTYEYWLASEASITENLTILFSLIAAVFAFKLIKDTKHLPQAKFFRVWFTLFAIALIYLAGEEASWGQHLIGWESGEYMSENNSMGETNLHNLNNAMEQGPKILLHLAAIFGGLIWPLIVYLKKINLSENNFFYWVMPNYTAVMSCLFAIALRLWERYYAWMGIKDEYAVRDSFKDLKEMNETFLALFMLVYLLSIYYRIKESKKV